MSTIDALLNEPDQPLRYDWAALVGGAFDLLADLGQTGADLATITERLEVDERVARRAINKLREELADSDANVVVMNEGRGRKYVLTTEGDEGWLNFNRRYCESRMQSVLQVYQAVLRGAETEENRKKADRVVRTIGRLIEDMADLDW